MLEILVVDEDRRYTRVAVECLTRDYNALVGLEKSAEVPAPHQL